MDKLTDFHLPVDMGEYDIASQEVMYYLYLPIRRPGSDGLFIPDDRLTFIGPLIEAVAKDEPERYAREYLYATIKKMYVGGGVTANRPGWHCDGFLSSDLNYVWYDCVPTVFVQGAFKITPDHVESLKEFDVQAEMGLHLIYPDKHLLKLDDRVIHKVNTDVPQQVMRTFVKLTLSKNRFNLKDNSRNPMLPDYGPYYERALVRNDPHQAQRDYLEPPAAKDAVDDHLI